MSQYARVLVNHQRWNWSLAPRGMLISCFDGFRRTHETLKSYDSGVIHTTSGAVYPESCAYPIMSDAHTVLLILAMFAPKDTTIEIPPGTLGESVVRAILKSWEDPPGEVEDGTVRQGREEAHEMV